MYHHAKFHAICATIAEISVTGQRNSKLSTVPCHVISQVSQSSTEASVIVQLKSLDSYVTMQMYTCIFMKMYL